MINAIYISNILEGYYASYQALSAKERIYWTRYDTIEGNRALFYNRDNKVIVTSYPINEQHFKYTGRLMGWKNVENFSPRHASASLCEDCIEDTQLRDKFTQTIKKNPNVAIIPYRTTPQFYNLIAYLHKRELEFTTPETMSREHEFILSYCHCKRGFRHLWSKAFPGNSKLNISLPFGFITGNKQEAIEAAWWFKQQKRSFVIKYNRGVQGAGIIFNDHSKLPSNKDPFKNQMSKLLVDKIWDEPSIIVEELILADDKQLGGSPSIEFFINEKAEVIPTFACEQILDQDKKTFRGSYLHPEIINNKHIITAFKAGKYFGKELAELGYRGCFDIDLVISKDDKLYAVESNMRRTGATHIYEAAIVLLGKKNWHLFHIINEDIILPRGTNLSYEKCFDSLKDLLFDKKTKSGFIFCNPDFLKIDIFNAIFIASSKEKIETLCKETKRRLMKLFGPAKPTSAS